MTNAAADVPREPPPADVRQYWSVFCTFPERTRIVAERQRAQFSLWRFSRHALTEAPDPRKHTRFQSELKPIRGRLSILPARHAARAVFHDAQPPRISPGRFALDGGALVGRPLDHPVRLRTGLPFPHRNAGPPWALGVLCHARPQEAAELQDHRDDLRGHLPGGQFLLLQPHRAAALLRFRGGHAAFFLLSWSLPPPDVPAHCPRHFASGNDGLHSFRAVLRDLDVRFRDQNRLRPAAGCGRARDRAFVRAFSHSRDEIQRHGRLHYRFAHWQTPPRPPHLSQEDVGVAFSARCFFRPAAPAAWLR